MREGDKFDVNTYLSYAGPVGDLAREVITKLAPKKGEKILDVGCGDGTVSRIIAESGADVYGIDVSDAMVRAAVQKGIKASVQSVSNLKFKDGEFDKIFSNSALHWVPDLEKGFVEMSRVLKDGGELSLEFGRTAPIEISKAVIKIAKKHGYDVRDNNPWNETRPNELRVWLKNLGYEDIRIESKSKLQSFPAGMRAWLDNFVSNTFLKDIPADKKEPILEEVTESLKKFPNYFAVEEKKEWFGDYQRINVTAKLNKEKQQTLHRYFPDTSQGGVRL